MDILNANLKISLKLRQMHLGMINVAARRSRMQTQDMTVAEHALQELATVHSAAALAMTGLDEENRFNTVLPTIARERVQDQRRTVVLLRATWPVIEGNQKTHR